MSSYNSQGAKVQTGTATITELSDGNAKANINFTSGLLSGATYTAGIYLPVVGDTTGAIAGAYAQLNEVKGENTETNPVKKFDGNQAKFSEIIAKTGYIIKVYQGSVVAGWGKIE